MSSPSPHRADAIARRSTVWQIRGQTLALGDGPLLLGVVNATPDSFSDGGLWLEPQAAVAHALQLVAEGADLLDVGGESTRPGSLPVDPDEQIRRVLPVIERLVLQSPTPISIDTRSARVAEAALAAGAQIVNDISALTHDPHMLDVVLRSECGVCLMHMQGDPQTMQLAPVYGDVAADVFAYLRTRRDALTAAGVSLDRIVLDPGIGFGKTVEHNLELMRFAWRFHDLGCPLLVGPSRKRFLGAVLGDDAADRTHATVGAALALADQGVQVLRVHDVAAVHQALLAYQACRE